MEQYEFKLGEMMQELRNINNNIKEIKDSIKCLNEKMDNELEKVEGKISTKANDEKVRAIVREEIKKINNENLTNSGKKISIINGLIGIGRFIFSVAVATFLLKYFMNN
jgi:predicted transcriptional regulator